MPNRTSNKNNATRTSPIAEQGALETDWVEATSTTLSTQPAELNVYSEISAWGNVGSEITLTNGNLTATKSATDTYTQTNAYAVVAIADGNIFYEITLTGTTNNHRIGISPTNTTQSVDFADPTVGGYSYYADGRKDYNGSFVAYGASYTGGDVIGVRYSYVTGELEFYKNGASQGVAYTLTAGTAMYPAISMYNGSTSATVNFGATAFTYTQPAGTSTLVFGSTTTSLVSSSTLTQGQEVTLVESDNSYTDGVLGAVTGTGPYSADITSYSLSTAPTKAFLKDDTSISLAIESTPERIVNEVSTYLTVDATTDTTNLVVSEPIYEGEKLFIDDTEVTLGAVTGSSPYSVAHGLGTTPTTAFRKGSKALTVTGTPTTTEIIGTHATSGLLTTGDTVLLDNNKPVVTTSVVESPAGTYTCQFTAQGSAPTTVSVPDRTQKLTVTSKLFDGTKFNYTYGNYVKGGRAMATKLESTTSGTTVLSPITTNLNKA